MKYQVLVGNVGSVYDGSSKSAAEHSYRHYVSLSKLDYGRSAGESITLMQGDKVVKEFTGSIAQNAAKWNERMN